MRWLRLWFSMGGPVGRREYVISGVVLGAIKYLGDVGLVYAATGRFWSLIDYLRPMRSLTADAPAQLLPALALWMLPFLWIGVNMSERRASDAGLSSWLALLFFIPGVNWLFMVAMSLWPTRRDYTGAHPVPSGTRRGSAWLAAILAGSTFGMAMLALSVATLNAYGIGLFMGTPFIAGALSAYLLNRRYDATAGETQGMAAVVFLVIGATALWAAQEGAICLIMAAPLGFALGAMGAVLGRRIARFTVGAPAHAAWAVLFVPALAVMDKDQPPTALREVRSAVVIDASPERVWPQVIAFPPLAEPSDLVFRSGISYPRYALVRGSGVGAVRYCVFSTGAFVEPITAWEPGRRLSFDVASSPPPMTEWSPYTELAPRHLDGYFASRRGEFRLVALPNGRTRLEGSTWYEMKLYPAAYWSLFGDALIHRIHQRVLTHIKQRVENR